MRGGDVLAGRFVAIVGPSGSGKDTLIDWLRERLDDQPAFHFVRRVVTRSADAELEDHASMDEGQFAEAEAAGAFAVVWRAHGLSYGIPAEVLQHVAGGGIAVANGSRRALAQLADAFGPLEVVELTVEPAVLAKRLAGRGRENEAQVAARLAQADIEIAPQYSVCRIDNSGPIDHAGEAVLAHLRRLAGQVPA